MTGNVSTISRSGIKIEFSNSFIKFYSAIRPEVVDYQTTDYTSPVLPVAYDGRLDFPGQSGSTSAKVKRPVRVNI